jgi:hypothetical protein
MGTIGDIADLLEKIPLWRRLKALPDQVEKLQQRIDALEAELNKRPTPEACPICGVGTLKVTNVKPHPVMGDLGIQERTLKCTNQACAHTEKRMHDPKK